MAKILINRVKEFLTNKEKSETYLKQKDRDKIISDLKLLEKLWNQYNLDRVYLYGSFADMTFYKKSDIDLAIELEIGFEDQLKLYTEVNKHFKRDVEIRLLKELPFCDKIKREGILIYKRKNRNTQK
jgi:predicted nucleotidyltransferase